LLSVIITYLRTLCRPGDGVYMPLPTYLFPHGCPSAAIFAFYATAAVSTPPPLPHTAVSSPCRRHSSSCGLTTYAAPAAPLWAWRTDILPAAEDICHLPMALPPCCLWLSWNVTRLIGRFVPGDVLRQVLRFFSVVERWLPCLRLPTRATFLPYRARAATQRRGGSGLSVTPPFCWLRTALCRWRLKTVFGHTVLDANAARLIRPTAPARILHFTGAVCISRSAFPACGVPVFFACGGTLKPGARALHLFDVSSLLRGHELVGCCTLGSVCGSWETYS